MESYLSGCRWVAEGAVLVPASSSDQEFFRAYIKFQVPENVEAEAEDCSGIGEWAELFDQVYSEAKPGTDSSFNWNGWQNSYTGELFSETEIREWLNGTIARIQESSLGQVLEIGCGTGMLLSRLSRHAIAYHATDISEVALAFVDEHRAAWKLNNVNLFSGGAEALPSLSGRRFDTIILNSVIQYFPGPQYLLNVLHNCFDLLSPQGRIFIGDVRNFRLAEQFWGSVLCSRSPSQTAVSHVRSEMQRILKTSSELLVDPEWFSQLPDKFSGISSVDAQLRRGRFENEMTKYRYDVTLCRQEADSEKPIAAVDEMYWCDEKTLRESLQKKLSSRDSRGLRICDIRNGRLQYDFRLRTLLEQAEGPETISQIVAKANTFTAPEPSFQPESFWELGKDTQWDIHVCWSRENPQNCFDVFCSPRASSSSALGISMSGNFTRPNVLTNSPAETRWREAVLSEMRNCMRQMWTSRNVLLIALDELPRGADRQVDYGALRSLAAPGR
jgi:2-polyprenyl-3-methyl-5-hydroxy-6-metoxy-1,4-benzoquinol methylase